MGFPRNFTPFRSAGFVAIVSQYRNALRISAPSGTPLIWMMPSRNPPVLLTLGRSTLPTTKSPVTR